MQTYIPQSLNTSQLTHPDKIACLTNHIYTAPALRRDFEEGQLVPLNKLELRKQYGRWNLDNAISEAISKGIIYQDTSYTCRKRSKGYCIGPSYINSSIGTYALKDQKLINRISNYAAKKREQERQSWSDIHKLLDEDLRKIVIDKMSEGEIWEMAVQDMAKFNPYLISYNMIRDKDWKFKVCQNGRVHTNFTNLNKHFRRRIRIHGEKLIKLDVKNCQPLLLVKTLKNYYLHKENRENTEGERNQPTSQTNTEGYYPIVGKFYNQPEIASNEKKLHLHKGYREDTDNQPTNQTHTGNTSPLVGRFWEVEKSILEYQKLCESGKFYEYIANDLGWDRKEAKQQLITYLFDRIRPTIISHYMKQQYPIIHNMMIEAKKDDYKCVANELQQQESSMMIQGCAFNFKRKYPNVPLITIHDCLCVPESFGYDKLEQVIYDSFGQYSLTPTLERE